jgi:hypothetical protein
VDDPDISPMDTFVSVAVPAECLVLVNGPTSLSFNLPAQVDRRFAWVEAGFNDLGDDVGFSTTFQPTKPASKSSVNLNDQGADLLQRDTG